MQIWVLGAYGVRAWTMISKTPDVCMKGMCIFADFSSRYTGASIHFFQECQVSSLSVPSSWAVETSLPLLTEHTACVFDLGDGMWVCGNTDTFLKVILE